MSQIKHQRTSSVTVLETDHLVGRSARAALQLDDEAISSQHATFLWDAEEKAWFVKDLASRNGTYVNGERIPAGERRRLGEGDLVMFASKPNTFTFETDTPPQVCLIEIESGEALPLSDGLVALPTPDHPEATVYRENERWHLEQDSATTALSDGAIIEVGGARWRLRLPSVYAPTATTGEVPRRVKDATIRFDVSQDEEHVQLWAIIGGQRIDLGTRAHNYMLLTLARLRSREAAEGLPVEQCGWVHTATLCEMLRVEREALNLHVFRLRKQLAEHGFDDAVSIIERRTDSGELRIACADLQFSRPA
ncbi:MAG: FHA domain-containing protein [Myxococcales bacterium]|nr:FHA domain-containing protein [Myxococcales bacterium]